ncbi:MAG: sigma-70 family RNA polymerase sigma factor [Ignavibacteriales bacterium]|nr:MAG: sigma-70 family RNA polymerase sigma factor [Ignavibacteriales bacterium]
MQKLKPFRMVFVNTYDSLTDLEVFRKVLKNDSKAFEILYDRYSELLYTLIKKIVIKEKIAEEILVDVFELIWKRKSEFDPGINNVYSWLVTISRNKAVDYLRRTRIPNPVTTPYDNEYEDIFIIPRLSPKIDSVDISTAFQIKGNVEKTLSKLTDAQKYVIHLAYYEGYTQSAIADKLKIPLSTVKGKVKIALNNLKENLIKEKE